MLPLITVRLFQGLRRSVLCALLPCLLVLAGLTDARLAAAGHAPAVAAAVPASALLPAPHVHNVQAAFLGEEGGPSLKPGPDRRSVIGRRGFAGPLLADYERGPPERPGTPPARAGAAGPALPGPAAKALAGVRFGARAPPLHA